MIHFNMLYRPDRVYMCVNVHVHVSSMIIGRDIFSFPGVRFYFTTTPDGIVARPSLLALVHARLPPGFSPSSSGQQRPGNAVHQAFYRRGALVLAASQSEEKDVLWIVDSELFPFQTALIESQVSLWCVT